MCDIWKNRVRQEIAPDDISRWREDWLSLGIKHVVLTGGEALLHSRFAILCETLRASDIAVILLSTGITLYRDAEAVASHCESVRVSLDGPEAIHNQIRRVPRAYEKLVRGVRRLKALRPELPIIARSAIHTLNCEHIPAIIDAAHEIGLDGISFLGTDVTSLAFNRDASTQAPALLLNSAQIDALETIIDRLADCYANDFSSGFIREGQAELHARLTRYYRAHLGHSKFPGNRCNAPWVSAVLEYDGSVRPCFFHASYGNVFEAGLLSEVLNSPGAIAFRRALDVAQNPICQRCVCSIALPRCSCGLTRNAPFCDRMCLIADLLDPTSVMRSTEFTERVPPE
jgi:MoaA/NifB/PqqE/SkfB family radical SAM enzyme